MTTDQYWQQLDTLAASKGTDRLLETAELLRDHPELPLLISCRRVHGRILHLFTSFDERSPDAVGNRYLICFTSEKQTKNVPVAPPAAEKHEAGPDFQISTNGTGSGGRRATTLHGLWKMGKPPVSLPKRCWPI